MPFVYIGYDFEREKVPLTQKYLCIFMQAWKFDSKVNTYQTYEF